MQFWWIFVFGLVSRSVMSIDLNFIPKCNCLDSDSDDLSNLNVSVNIAFRNNHRRSQIQSDACGLNLPRDPNLLDEYSYEGEFPWFTAIYTGDFQHILFKCAGTLISKSAVLTSGACLTQNRNVQPEQLLVLIGSYNYIEFGGHYQHRKIKEIVFHPEFNYIKLENDLAILKLRRSVKITDYVRPICLWDIGVDGGNLVGQELIHPGWDYTPYVYVNEKLSYIRMPVRPKDECIFHKSRIQSLRNSKSMFCTSFRINSPTCKGDAGSGLYIKINRVWYIRGIDTISIGYQSEVVCDDRHYVAATDITPYKQWINQYI